VSLCLDNKAVCHEDVWGNGSIIDLGISRLYPRPKSPRYLMDRILSGPRNRSERYNLTGTRTPSPRPSSPANGVNPVPGGKLILYSAVSLMKISYSCSVSRDISFPSRNPSFSIVFTRARQWYPSTTNKLRGLSP
jgi:hypothetical protein